MNQEEGPILDQYDDEYSAVLKRVERLAQSLDAQFSIPGTQIQFGWDALVGLIPVAGDVLTLIPQFYLFFEAFRLKVRKRTLMRMLLNILVDWLVGSIPILGDLFDVAFKSNLRNAKLLAEAIRKKRAEV